MTTPTPVEARTLLKRELDVTAKAFGLVSADEDIPHDISVAALRRGRRRPTDDPIGSVSLVEHEGVLGWQDAPPSLARGRRAGSRGSSGELIATYRFEKLEPNKVGEVLEALDLKLTPTPGLKSVIISKTGKTVRWKFGPPQVPASGRVLLIIHGTFSESSAILNQFVATPEGQQYLADASVAYQAVLAFDHPTLSLSPLLNAFDLQQAFAGKKVDVDIVAHSRGGLVARWWLEGFGPARGESARAVFVGSPLNGTGLAAPPRLRATLNLLTNYGHALQLIGDAAVAVPFIQVPLVLLKVIGSVTGVLAKTPVTDAAISMIPGLACQSRVSNNEELKRIRSGPLHPHYFAVTSNFEPEAVGWKFWRMFRKDQVANLGADLLFSGDNDLVVDTTSMKEFSSTDFPADRAHDFGTNAEVHHVNYFRQPKTVEFLRSRLSMS